MPIAITELGVEGNGKGQKLVAMMQVAETYPNVKLVIIHEFNNEQGWGLENNGKPNASFKVIQNFTQEDGKNRRK